MKQKNRNLILAIIAISSLVVFVVGFSFAYFLSQTGYSGDSAVSVQTTTLDSLIYSEGSALELIATQDNFAQGLGNRYGSTEGTVTLNVNNMTPATYCYTADIVISTNEFIYSVNNSTPELVISVSKKTNEGSYQTIINNQDITTTSGTVHIPVASGSNTLKHTISGNANAVVVDRFKVDLSLLNLSANQNANVGHIFNGRLELTTVDC